MRLRGGIPAALVVLITVWVVGVAAPAADAGTYGISASGQAFCSLGQFIANVPGFGSACDDSVGQTLVAAPIGGAADTDRELFQITSPDPALTIVEAVAQNGAASLTDGYSGGTYWNGGGASWAANVNTAEDSGPITSSYWGFQIVCADAAGCGAIAKDHFPPNVEAGGVNLTVEEDRAPSLVAAGTNNLYYQTRPGEWVWNPAGDPWDATMSATDPSGVCNLGVTVNGRPNHEVLPQNYATWQQCPSPAIDQVSVDTTSTVSTSGQLTLELSAQNAALVPADATATINVDNIAPSLTIKALNDPDPGGWSVNHAVTLQIVPSTGPSGISSLTCNDTVGGHTQPLTLTADPTSAGDDDVTINGNGAHTVACTLANNAVDPQGAHHSTTTQLRVAIDEQAPTLTFEATDPANPDQLVVDTADDESAVNGGSLAIARTGSSTFTPLATSFTSSGQLIATIPDASLAPGSYTVRASATSQVGNSASATETLRLPLRSPVVSLVSVSRIQDPLIARRVRERVRVGFHYVTVRRHGRRVKVKRGGHYRTITVIKRVQRCHVVLRRRRRRRQCIAPKIRYRRSARVRHGASVRVFGELTTAQGVPLASQHVTILATPVHNDGPRRDVARAITNARGGWSARVPAGPSRIITVSYAGTATTLPSERGAVRLTVPAKLTLRVHRVLNGELSISGRLLGGYVPSSGVAMRLLLRYHGVPTLVDAASFRTTASGRFAFLYAPPAGASDALTGAEAALDGSEADYPWAAGRSPLVGLG